ncbi:MAG: hypothetical protein AAB215_09480 [Planctomycetota bacterium]
MQNENAGIGGPRAPVGGAWPDPAPSISGAWGWIELLRRVGFLAGILATIALALQGQGAAAPYALVGALAFYLLLPRRRRGPDEVFFSPARSSILPDLAGLLLVAPFFAIPLLVIPRNAPAGTGLFDPEGGWMWLTIICWAFAAGALSIHFIALRYAVFSIRILPDRLRIRRLGSERDWPFAEIAAVEPAELGPPKWLRVVFAIGAIASPRHAGTLILGSLPAGGIAVRRRDGRTLRLPATGLNGMPLLALALRAANVPMPPEFAALANEAKPAAPGGRAGGIVSVALFVLFAGIILALAHLPARAPKPKPAADEPPVSIEDVMERDRIFSEMKTVKKDLDAAYQRLEKASAAERPAAIREYQALSGRFEALHQEYEAVGTKDAKKKAP